MEKAGKVYQCRRVYFIFAEIYLNQCESHFILSLYNYQIKSNDSVEPGTIGEEGIGFPPAGERALVVRLANHDQLRRFLPIFQLLLPWEEQGGYHQ
jgi:hypothetical protein